ncbi:MAG: Rne/Rng family ribonuclease [Acidimicrobiaceae bacterium]|nr:Rne/Rng family ribonuclease [Acidimicrobiaceae bacterium]MYE66049.1 Rne/Rng family ribonuclease [Acidimicrobiaceae bacterium]
MSNERNAAGAPSAAEKEARKPKPEARKQSAKQAQASKPPAGRQADPARGSSGRSGNQRRPDQPARKPQIGDTRPAPPPVDAGERRSDGRASEGGSATGGRRRRRRRGGGNRSGQKSRQPAVVEAVTYDEPVELDEKSLKGRRGRTRKGQALGRYLMCVHVSKQATQIAVLEGRRLIEFRVSRPADDISQIHGNIYLGRVQNVLPGMETAFVDIGTPKNAVLYRGDVQYDPDEIEGGRTDGDQVKPRIEELLKPKQSILCQVTKNPIGEKGARLTQDVSLAGRFVVLVPNSTGFGISKRLPDGERRRLRSILEKVKPDGHGLIMRTAAEKVTAAEIERDVVRLLRQWKDIEKLAKSSAAPALLYREPEAPLRLIREELNTDYRGVIIDDQDLYSKASGYISSIIPPLADRVEYYNPGKQDLPLFERYYVTEQLKKALEPKVWLPSGGSLIIEHTEALTVVDVNTGKNVGKSSLEETVLANNLEAADELARQLRLRDIGGIIVVDFVDMEVAANRAQVTKRFREALARDKTRTQVLDISGLGLMEMTRKRSGEGLLESLSDICSDCSGRGFRLLADLID